MTSPAGLSQNVPRLFQVSKITDFALSRIVLQGHSYWVWYIHILQRESECLWHANVWWRESTSHYKPQTNFIWYYRTDKIATLNHRFNFIILSGASIALENIQKIKRKNTPTNKLINFIDFEPFGCWGRNILGALILYFERECPCSLRCQDMSSRIINM